MIQPTYLTLDKLLQGRLFQIPDYQRTYSWTAKQRQDLFSDIVKLANYKADPDRHHFMATAVCFVTKTSETIGADEFEISNIVDGQQRLTTLIILLKEIYLALNQKNPAEKKTKEDLGDLLVKRDRRLILLQTNHDSSNIFKNYLRDSKDPPENKFIQIQADLNIVSAIRECRNFVKSWRDDGGSFIDLLRLTKNRLAFVLYILHDEAPVYTVFEVLNSRGLDVDSLDKCKSMLMGIAFEKCGKAKNTHIKELYQNWKKIYQFMGRKLVPGHEILRFAVTLHYKSASRETLSEEISLEWVRGLCETDPNRVTDVSQWLLDVAEKLEELYKNPRREAVTKIVHARLLAVAILLADHLTIPEKNDLLASWEKITFRIFGMYRKDARTKRGDFTKLAWDILNNKFTKNNINATLEDIGKEYPINEAVKEMVKERNCYDGWEEELRYFLFRYEEYLIKKENLSIDNMTWEIIWNNTAYSTIEHIFPQEPSHGWGGKMGPGRDTIRNNVHRLGNLVLLPPGKNSEAHNKNFKDKKKIYEKIPLRIIREITLLTDWNKKAIDEREKQLVAWAEKEWR